MNLWKGLKWKDLGRSVWHDVKDDHVPNGAAALAFYMVLAVFPAAIFGLSLLPYLPIPHLQQAVMDLVHQALPSSTADTFAGTVQKIVSQRRGGLLSFGLLLTIWSASSGLYAVMQQLNVVYEVDERRSFVKARALAIGLTLVFFVLVVGALALVIGGGWVQSWMAHHLGWSAALRDFFAVLRWIVILLALQLALAVVYWAGPNVKQPFEYFAPGTTFATLGLVLASVLFRVYVQNFGHYDRLYGSLGAIIVLLMWLFVAGWVILLGGEINERVENQKGIVHPPRQVRT